MGFYQYYSKMWSFPFPVSQPILNHVMIKCLNSFVLKEIQSKDAKGVLKIGRQEGNFNGKYAFMYLSSYGCIFPSLLELELWN